MLVWLSWYVCTIMYYRTAHIRLTYESGNVAYVNLTYPGVKELWGIQLHHNRHVLSHLCLYAALWLSY